MEFTQKELYFLLNSSRPLWLRRVNLSGADLSGANLTNADLSGANLSGANLSDANLSGANLTGADLSDSAFIVLHMATKDMDDDTKLIMVEIKAMTEAKRKLRETIADLNRWITEERGKFADSSEIDNQPVSGAGHREATLQLAQAKTVWCTRLADLLADFLDSARRLIPLELYVSTSDTDDALRLVIEEMRAMNEERRRQRETTADMQEEKRRARELIADEYKRFEGSGDISNPAVRRADHREATLYPADLSGADLSAANLAGAIVTDEQLAQAKSLKGATMPDGTVHK